jgi:hypothetical protein
MIGRRDPQRLGSRGTRAVARASGKLPADHQQQGGDHEEDRVTLASVAMRPPSGVAHYHGIGGPFARNAQSA